MNTPYQLTIAAGQGVHNAAGGMVLSVKSCTLPIQVSFDGGAYQTVSAGTVLDMTASGGFGTLNFLNITTLAVTITFYVGDSAVNFAPSDSSQSNAATYVLGNLGVAIGAAAANGLPACDATGYLQITAAMGLVVPAIDSTGHRRQAITFSVSSNSAVSLVVMDINGFVYAIIAKGQIIQLTTDAALKISGLGGTAAVSIGQIFLGSN